MGKLVKVEGQVAVKDGASLGIEFYEAEFLLDDAVAGKDEARALIQSGLITNHLKKTVPNFKRWRTCEVVSFDAVKDKAQNSELDALTLEAISLSCLPENIDIYRTDDAKIKALKKALKVHKDRGVAKDSVQDAGYVD